MRQRTHAFTLIELLVTITVLGLLISILLPSLVRARAQSKSLLCMSNLRQLSHGWHAYTDENNDTLLPGRFAKEPGGTRNPANWYEVGNGRKYRPRWVATMGLHVGLFPFDHPSTSDDRQDYVHSVYQCPAVPDWIDERNYAYGYNHQFLGNARKTGGRFHNFPVSRNRIRNFAGTVLAADCLGTAAGLPLRGRRAYSNNGTEFNEVGNHGWTLDPPRLTETSDRGTGDDGSPRTAVDARHMDRTSVVYCDGHTESQLPDALGYRVLPDGAFVDLDNVERPPTNRLFSGSGRDEDPPDLPS